MKIHSKCQNPPDAIYTKMDEKHLAGTSSLTNPQETFHLYSDLLHTRLFGSSQIPIPDGQIPNRRDIEPESESA